MRNIMVSFLIIAVATPALAFKVFTHEGLPCYHTFDQMPWTMRINNLGTPDCANEFNQVETALNTWSNVTGQWYRNARGPNTSLLNYGYDGTNLIVWYEPDYYPTQQRWPFPAGASAVNAYWGRDMGSFYLVVENDLCYNGYNYSWSDSGQSGRMDVQNTAAHEFGHNLMLADLYESSEREFTMYVYTYAGETKKRTLEYDDINGIRYLYNYQGVKLESFTATACEGRVLVTWKVSRELNHAGYNLHRLEDVGGADYVKLNKALIVGRSPYEFEDRGVKAGRGYKYLLEAVDLSGQKERFGPARVDVPAGARPAFALAQSRPNPARTAATIVFSLPEASAATLEVYDLSGRRVATLYSGAAAAGEREVVWNLADDNGAAVPPGVYVYRLQAPGHAAARRMVVSR